MNLVMNPKKLIEKARKRRMASMEGDDLTNSNVHTAMVAAKGHFHVYTTEGKRFMVPLSYLDSHIFKELLRMSEEEFGLRGNGPITLPCDAAFMEHIMSLFRGQVSEDMRRVFFSSAFTHHCSSSSLLVGNSQQLVS